VIKVSSNSSLVCTTPYLRFEIPDLSDPILLQVLNRSFFAWKNEPSITWVDGNPPELSLLIGNIPLSEAEESMESNVFSGKWGEHVGLDVFRQWRWDHDRDAFVDETNLLRQERERRLLEQKHKPKKMMNDDAFWHIISLLDWKHQGDDEKVIEPAVLELSRMSKRDINQFAEALAYRLYLLDTKEHARNIGEYAYKSEDEFFSVDGFLYARCAVIANGKYVYESALKDPASMLKGLEFESLLSIASTAYELKTDHSFDHETGCSYETFSNRKGWE
jgi:Protein of unknown function (DUF4240)